MNNRPTFLTALISGATAGFVILGLAGLFVSFVLAMAYHVPTGPFTLRRLLEPVLLGTIMGAIFALPLVWLHRRIPEKPLFRILAVGITPFILSLLLMFLRRPPTVFSWESVITPLLVLTIFLLYGFYANRLYGCWNRKQN